MFQLLILFACILLSVISEAEGGQCEENSTLVNLGGGSSRCFGLLLQQGLVSRNEALRQCRSHFRDPSLPQSISTKVGHHPHKHPLFYTKTVILNRN